MSFAGEVTQSSQTKETKEDKFSPTPRKDGESTIDYAERVAEEHQAQRTRKEEEAKIDTNPTEAEKPTEENAAPANTQTEKTNNSRGDSQSKEQPTEVPTGVRSSNENGTLPQSTPTEVESETDYTLSDKKAENGENFYQNANGNIDLANIPEEVFDKIGKPKAPLRLTPSMLKHVFDRHGKEMGLSRTDDAIDFILDVMDNFDHVRQGDKNAVIFSIENGRSRTGRRAVTILLNSESGEYYGIKTSGYERIEGLNKKPLLWEKGANETSATGAAPANVTTEQAQQGSEPAGSASNHSNGSIGKVTQSSQTKETKEDKLSPTPRKDGESITDYAERVAEEHQAQRTRKEEEAKVDTNPTEAQKPTEENAAPANTQTEETNNSRGDSQSKEQPTEVPTGVRSSNENGTLPQSTPTEVDEPQPIGNSFFGKVYNQFKGKAKEAVNFLMRHKSGKLLGVFHRNDIGEISLVWGDEKGGLAHIISKHIVEQNDFNNIDEVINTMQQVINNGTITRENKDKVVIDYNDYRVAIRKQTRDNNGNVVEQGNWIVTAFDKSRSKKDKTPSEKTLSTPPFNQETDGVTLPSNGVPTSKGTQSSQTKETKEDKFSPTPRKDGESITDYAERVAEEHQAQRTRKEEEAKVDTNPKEAARQQTTATLTNDTEAKQKATEAVLTALDKVGIEVVQATDEEVKVLLSNSHTTTLRTPQGTIYGWSVNGKIYLTEAGINPDTPIHEYTHLWADAMMRQNKQGWDSIKSLLKDTPVWKEVIADPNYSNIKDNEDAVASEVLSRISGRKNAAKMEAEAQKAINKAKGILEKANATTILLNLKRAIKQFWYWVGKNVFGIKDFKNIDEVTDRVLYDLLNNTKLTEEDNEEIAKRDKLYLDAVERGDMETAQRMVNEAAAQNGYVPNSEYQGSSAFNGAAPYGNGYFLTKEERKGAYENDEFDGDTSLDDYVNSGIDPMNLDYLTNDSSYRHADDARKEAIENLRNVFQNKRQTITMYRSVPSSIKEGSFRNGDWVTPSYAYAVENARVHGWGNKYRIIEQEVPISDVWFDGNDIAEFGYGNEDDFINDKDYLYSNTKNNQKLPDAVTYDDKGNVIPLSKRFNKAKSDPRFQITDSALSDEEKKIVETAKANDTYMKAPNGKPTNLSEKQWAQVRTKAFKKWFGDWEKAARIEKLRRSKSVKITGEEIEPNSDLKQYKKNALEYGKNLRGEYTNKDTGETIALTGGNSRGGMREILQHDYKDIEHLQSIAAIPQIIEKAIFVDEAPNEDAERYPGVKSFRYYVCGLKIGNTNYTVKAVVAVQNNGDRYYDHKLSSIEKGKLLSIIPTIQKAGIENNLPPSVGKDKRLLSILQTNSSKVVDENGEPMVVYHGTLADGLRQFSTDFIGSRYSYDEKGFFFISNRKIADDYAVSEFDASRRGEVIDAYVSLGNPLVVNSEWCRKNGLGSNVFKDNDVIEFWDNYQSLIVEESEQNDGVIVTDGETSMVVAFFPNQIKSATGNNGNFSTTKDDILYRSVFGGNSGYVGYSMSKRAAEAKEEGRYPKTEFRREYHITAKSLDMLTSLGFIDNSEWHHTSMYGNKTPFYGWAEDEFAGDYLKHKKEVDTLCKGIDPKTKQPLLEKVEKPQYEHEYEMPQYGEAETAANPIREWRHKQIEKYDQFTGFKGYANATEEEKKERDAYLHSLNEQMEEKIREMLAKDYPDYLAAKNALDAYNNYEEDLRKAIGERIKEYLDIDKYSQRWREQTTTTQPTTNTEELNNHAESVVQNLHLNNVEIVPDGSSLNGEQATAKGFYDKRTGKIVVVASNHTDIADIEKTVLHEAVAHHGLRELFGDNFDNFLDTVFAKADIETRQQIAHLSAKHGWNVRTATEEYLASMAEDTNFSQIKPTLWQRIKQLFGEIMSAFGLHHANITDNDLRYILWRSYKNLQNSDKHSILDIAENIAMQYRLKVGNYTDKFTDELNAVNERFNEELSNLTEENADKVTLWLGKPSKVLLAAGVEDKPMKLYGNKVIRKMKKHGFSLEELRDLPRAVADPVAVFNNYQREGNRSILTELKTQQGNFLVSVNIGKDADINFNIVRSVFGKGNENVVAWINNGLATYINKEKALSFLSHQSAPIAATAANAGQESSSYLHLSAPIAEAAENSELSSAAKIIKDFHNPKLNSNVLYRSSIDPTATEVLPDARTRYEKETKEPDNIDSVPKTHNFFRRFYKSYVDSMLALKSFTNSVLEATDDKMASHEDTYKAENAMTSKNKTDGEVYNPLFPYMPLYLYM
ncbi:ADP-ribosyltransferase-containing protein [Prevotella pallens]